MSALPLTAGRRGLTAFRLADVPLAVRRDAGVALARAAAEDAKLVDRVFLERAIEFPSETVYWIPTEAWERERRTRSKWR